MSQYDTLILAEPSLVAFYKMNDTPSGGNITIVDSGGGGHNSNNVSAAAITSVTGLVLDGENALANSNSSNAVPGLGTGFPHGNGDWAIEAWTNTATFPTSEAAVFGFGAAVALQTAIMTLIKTGGNNVFACDVNGAGNSVISAALATGVHYVIAQHDGTNNIIWVYVDNDAGHSHAVSALSIPTNPTFNVFNAPVSVGSFSYVGTAQKIAVYNAMLSSAQRTSHFNAGQGIFPSRRKVYGAGSMPLVSSQAGKSQEVG